MQLYLHHITLVSSWSYKAAVEGESLSSSLSVDHEHIIVERIEDRGLVWNQDSKFERVSLETGLHHRKRAESRCR